jgi:hypothetical protein
VTRSSRVVYTAITNRHAQLSARPLASDTDFICYSDVPLDRDDWQIRPVEAPALPPRMRAKFHKLHPPEGYEWNVWIDGAYVLRPDAVRFVDDLIAHSPSGFGLHRHNQRDCLFEEAEHTVLLDKYSGQRGIIEAQVRHYEELGHPKSWGLWAGGLMCRNTSPIVTAVMRRWWDELLRWSSRDQLSLPFVLRFMNFWPDVWPWPLFENPYMAGWAWNQFDRPVDAVPQKGSVPSAASRRRRVADHD